MSPDPTTTQDTLTVAAILEHLAVELCALEQLHGRPLTLQDAAAFLCAEVEA